MEKKIIFSGIKPSGDLTLGNYIGAIKNWKKLQKDFLCFYSVVDLHAITVRQDPATLRKHTLDNLALYLAAGLDPDENVLFIQSHVPQHAELSWLLNCYLYMGELSRMTQFKDKAAKQGESISVGLFDYPVLMAADILLYQTDLVPVGEDQRQHLELARDVAMRFNHLYSDTFKVPEGYTSKSGARVMGLQDPLSKMSKSGDNENDYILILDSPEVIRKKLKRAVTDSKAVIADADDQPGIQNLLRIYSALTGKEVSEVLSLYEGKGYGALKDDVAECIISELAPLQARFKVIREDKAYLTEIYQKGAASAMYHAEKTLSKVKRKIGLIPKK